MVSTTVLGQRCFSEPDFEYSQYFSSLFKNKVGKTPLGYRNLN